MLHCKTMKFRGLTNNEVLKSREQNGTNQLTQLEQDPIWKKVLEGFKDPMIMILLVALAIQIVFCFGTFLIFVLIFFLSSFKKKFNLFTLAVLALHCYVEVL